jgi:site-specific DNA-cytosine methylase
MTMQTTTPVEIRHFHLFCGLGGGARGFNRASPRVGNLQAKFRCLGGIDVDPASIRDFGRLAGVPGTVLDLFDREQYRTFHGAEPPADWREATAADIQRAAGGERPNIVFLSAPCKGFSGLLSEGKSKTDKYQALNRLTLRGVWLMLEAWSDDPPELVIFENVPRIATRGRHLLDQIVALLRAGMLGVQDWTRHSSTVTGKGRPSCGNFAVADPRFEQSALWSDGQAYGVRRWDASTGTVAGQQGPGQGAYSVADPRHHGPAKHSNEYRVVRWDRAAMAVTSAHGTGQAVADPRRDGPSFGKYAVTPYGTHAGTVISGSTTGQGAFAVADPRSGMDAERTAYTTGGHYGVVPWDSQAGAVSGAACHDNGRWSVADPRMPAAADKLVCRIVSEDGTWHRPFTTLELAHLQSLVEPDELLELDGTSDQAKRERIGNAVPSEAGEAIAHVMGETLLLALSGETFILSAQPVWVRPIALGLAMGTTA